MILEAEDIKDGLAYCIEEPVHLGIRHRIHVLAGIPIHPPAQNCRRRLEGAGQRERERWGYLLLRVSCMSRGGTMIDRARKEPR